MKLSVLCGSLAGVVGFCLSSSLVAESMLGGGTYGNLSEKSAGGPHMKIVSATDFGGLGHEEFIAAGELADGTIVAFGNAWGPQAPSKPTAVVLGRGAHSGKPATVTEKDGKTKLDMDSPDRSGIIVLYSRDPSGLKAKQFIRFDWGVASITAARTTGDGKHLIVAGRCQPTFASLASATKNTKTVPPGASGPTEAGKGKGKKADAPSGDVYVASITPDGKFDWIVVLQQVGKPPENLFLDGQGRVYLDAHGLTRITADRSLDVTVVSTMTGGRGNWLNVDAEGRAYYGGDRNTNTGRQPWRQPYLYQYNDRGEKTLTIYEFNPKECACGGDGNGLCSDSSVRQMAFDSKGNWWFGGWSDGGNSVFGRQATDWHQNAPEAGFGMNAAGVGVASLAHLMHIEAGGKQTLSHTLWIPIGPQFLGNPDDPKQKKARGRPGSARLKHLAVLEHDELSFTGGATSGLIQTPNSLWKDPMLPDYHSGDFVTIFRPDMKSLLFSSYLPGVAEPNVAPCKNGAIVVGRASQDDGWTRPTPSPSVNADQKFGGETDGFVMLLEFPGK